MKIRNVENWITENDFPKMQSEIRCRMSFPGVEQTLKPRNLNSSSGMFNEIKIFFQSSTQPRLAWERREKSLLADLETFLIRFEFNFWQTFSSEKSSGILFRKCMQNKSKCDQLSLEKKFKLDFSNSRTVRRMNLRWAFVANLLKSHREMLFAIQLHIKLEWKKLQFSSSLHTIMLSKCSTRLVR